MSDELIALSARDMAAGIREKKFSSEELVAAHIAQIEATSPAINAVVAMRADEALDEARAADAALAKVIEDATGGWQPPEI